MDVVSSLQGWTKGSFTAASLTRETYRKGNGPVVIVIHEITTSTHSYFLFLVTKYIIVAKARTPTPI